MNSTARQQVNTGEAELPMFGFSLSALLAEVRRDFPALSSWQIEVWLQSQPTLATVRQCRDKAVIALHSVLNHAHTPERVIGFILRHELLHLLIPPREVDGVRTTHPPEFWEAERSFPDRHLAWRWLTLVLGSCLRRDKKPECTFVTRKWKPLMNLERASLDQITGLIRSTDAPGDMKSEPLL